MLYIYKYIILRERKMHTILKKRVAFHLQEMKISPPRAAPRRSRGSAPRISEKEIPKSYFHKRGAGRRLRRGAVRGGGIF